MELTELIQARDAVSTQYNNLNNPDWLSQELRYLLGKFDLLNEMINKLESEEKERATTTKQRKQKTHSN